MNPELITTTDEQVDQEKKEPEIVPVDGENVESASKRLTYEEEFEVQRDVAFKVVFFFIAFIIFCFALLFVYHKLQQASIPQRENK